MLQIARGCTVCQCSNTNALYVEMSVIEMSYILTWCRGGQTEQSSGK